MGWISRNRVFQRLAFVIYFAMFIGTCVWFWKIESPSNEQLQFAIAFFGFGGVALWKIFSFNGKKGDCNER